MSITLNSGVTVAPQLRAGTRLTLLDYVFPRVSGVVPSIGDGLTHPMSGFYASLAAAQVDYPFLTSTWHGKAWGAVELFNVALQAGINDSKCARLMIPRGVYLANVYIDITNRYLGGFRLYGAAHQSTSNSAHTAIVGQTGGVLFDLSGSEFINLEDFAIYPGTSTIGILQGRTTDGVAFQSQYHSYRNLIIAMANTPTANGGVGTIGIANYASELSRHYNLVCIANNPYFASIHNPTPFYAKTSDPDGVWFEFASPNPSVHMYVGTTVTPATFSLGNLSFEGQSSFITSLNPALAINGCEMLQVSNAYFRNNSANDAIAAINILGGCTSVDISGTAEEFQRVCITRASSFNVKMNVTRGLADASIPSVEFDNVGGTLSTGFQGCQLNIPHVNLSVVVNTLGGTPAALIGHVFLGYAQGLNLTTGGTQVDLDIYAQQSDPPITLPTGASYVLKGLGRREFGTATVNPTTQYTDIFQNGHIGVNNDLLVIGATNATPIVVTVKGLAHRLANAQAVTIFGVTGNTAANGTLYAKTSGYGATQFALYSNVGLTTPVAGSGAFSGGNGVVRASGRQSLIVFEDAAAGKYYMGNNANGSFILQDQVAGTRLMNFLGANMILGAAGVRVIAGEDFTVNGASTLTGAVTATALAGSGVRAVTASSTGLLAPVTATASGGAVATTGATSTTPYGFTTAAQADAIITLLNNIRTALVANGVMS